jgi:hypothetical protein
MSVGTIVRFNWLTYVLTVDYNPKQSQPQARFILTSDEDMARLAKVGDFGITETTQHSGFAIAL